jgi:methionine synthase I (cobalamin-dependent)
MKKPANPKLYATIVAMARAKYSSYPNPGASAWVHKRYVQAGGQFIETNEATRKITMAKRKQDKEKAKHLEEKKDVKKDKKK